MYRQISIACICAVALAFASCGSDKSSNSDDSNVPEAPTGLSGMVMDGGIHLTWADNSDNEDEFMLERKEQGGTFASVYTAPFNTTQYHDAPLTSGTTYIYRISAMNAQGMSEPSPEFTMTMP